ncbi:hypothetical protein C8J56DRAFT_1164918 [Mycena floridula]|nr:hypothetical protein C8J56DRAFT_1164918 [Mycena floridula]
MGVFAQELLNHTLDFLHDDPRTLAACALSSNCLLDHARGHLYWELDINALQADSWPGAWWWSQFHFIGRYVRCLKMRGRGSTQDFSSIPIEVWDAIPRNLSKLHLAAIIWSPLPHHVQQCLLQVDAKDVVLEYIKGPPRSYMCTFPSCTTLRFATATHYSFGEETLTEPSNVTKITLIELHVDAPEPKLWSSHPLIDLSSLEYLGFSMSRRSSAYHREDFNLIRATSSKLKHLRLTVPRQTPELLNSAVLDLHSFPCLETLHLDWDVTLETARSLETFISSFPEKYGLKTIIIDAFPHWDLDADNITTSTLHRFPLLDWESLDRVLGDVQRSAQLRRVRLVLRHIFGPGGQNEMNGVAEMCSEKLAGAQKRGILEIRTSVKGNTPMVYLAPN